MGTRFELVLPDTGRDARAIGEAALEEIELLHRKLTRFVPDSLLSHINRTAAAAPVRLDRATWALFRDALTVHRDSDGAFDIGGSQCIELDETACTIRFRDAGVAVDLGGIAKGHAVDCAVAVLRAHGVTSALLHGGTSSVAAIGGLPGGDGWAGGGAGAWAGGRADGTADGRRDGSPHGSGDGTSDGSAAGWRVALARTDGAPVIALRDATLSVSWPLSQRDSRRRPVVDPVSGVAGDPLSGVAGDTHIVDPRTGESAGDTVVGVIGASARLGDAWATAIAVLGHRPDRMPGEWTTCITRAGAAPEWHGPASPGSS